MRYWCIPRYDECNNVDVMSEDDILKEYYDHWYTKMCEKFGKEHVDDNYNRKDCIDDYVITRWGWLSD